MSIDRASGIALAALALLVLEETWRQRLPVGSIANPGPAYFPGVLALLLLVAGAALTAGAHAGARRASLQWREWRPAAGGLPRGGGFGAGAGGRRGSAGVLRAPWPLSGG